MMPNSSIIFCRVVGSVTKLSGIHMIPFILIHSKICALSEKASSSWYNPFGSQSYPTVDRALVAVSYTFLPYVVVYSSIPWLAISRLREKPAVFANIMFRVGESPVGTVGPVASNAACATANYCWATRTAASCWATSAAACCCGKSVAARYFFCRAASAAACCCARSVAATVFSAACFCWATTADACWWVSILASPAAARYGVGSGVGSIFYDTNCCSSVGRALGFLNRVVVVSIPNAGVVILLTSYWYKRRWSVLAYTLRY